MLIILGTFYRSDGDIENFACEWLKANKVVWSTWVPDKLNPKRKIYLGGLFPDNMAEFSSIGIGAQLAVEAVNKDGNILSSHEIELIVDGSDGSDAVASYLRLQSDKAKPIIGVIGPMESDDSKVVGLIAGLYKTVVISYSAESPILSSDVQFPYFARTIPSADEDAYALIEFFKTNNWKRYAALSDSTISSLEVISAVEDILESHEITLVSSQSFTTPLPLNPALFFQDIKNQRASIIIGKFSDAAARVLLCEAYQQDVTGYAGYQWFLPSHYPDGWWDTDYYNSDMHEPTESVPCRTHEMALAVAGYMSLSRMSVAEGGQRVIGGLSATQWHERYQRELIHQGKQATDFAAYAYDAVWTFALAYEKLLHESPGALTVSRQNREMQFIMETLSQTEFEGMTGKVVFDGTDRRGPIRIFQHLPLGSKVITSIAQYAPHKINSSVWTGTFEVNASDIVWLNDGKIPHDGTIIDGRGCAVESFRSFLNVDCQSAMAILNAFLIIVVFVILIIFVVLVKKAYDRKIKKAEERVKDLGIIALGQSTLLSLDKWEIPRTNVILNRKLGEGAFGTVYGGEALLTGTKWVGVAVKTLKVESTIEEKLDFLSEAEMMKRFDHKNIVQLLGVCTRREPIYAIMDFMLHGDLKTFLLARRHLVSQSSSNDMTVSPERLTAMVLDVATGLRYLASHKYVHRDLACRNCLVDCSYTVKIADFGMTRATYDSNYYRLSREGKMPVRWMAPESVNEGIFTTKSDIWSLGIIIYEVVTFGGFPYKDLSNAEVLEFIRHNNAMRPPDDCSPSLAGLMQRCWSIEPEERPTASDVVEILSVNLDLIQPSINEPVMNILEDDLAHSRTAPRGNRADSFQSEGTIMDFDPPNISRTDQVASLGRRLRASFVRTLSWNRRRSHTLHTIEMSDAESKHKDLESSTQELVPSTFSVITCTTRSSLISLNQSMRTSLRSTSAPRDSSSSSGVDFNITDSVSGEMTVGGGFVLRRSATDSDIIDPTVNNNSKMVGARQNKFHDLNLQPGFVVQIGDESLLLPTRKSRQHRRSRSRSLGNLRSPHTSKKVINERCLNSEESKA
ncbi:gamma-aminobutyric acid type B receptor subunit 1-like [Asterias rubens]|uniref:gamma-aminobutyric acid type B receptor subunit 1-like n=1 Tax=Asterias rubens TaxID=7604 RepID=UPI001454F524|nr:gamma-aminobutyric acid type B receptor subunit 1-like [Asterias rubens]